MSGGGVRKRHQCARGATSKKAGAQAAGGQAPPRVVATLTSAADRPHWAHVPPFLPAVPCLPSCIPSKIGPLRRCCRGRRSAMPFLSSSHPPTPPRGPLVSPIRPLFTVLQDAVSWEERGAPPSSGRSEELGHMGHIPTRPRHRPGRSRHVLPSKTERPMQIYRKTMMASDRGCHLTKRHLGVPGAQN